MAGQDWSITITPSMQYEADAAFAPNPQDAEGNDLISWNNRTGAVHQPWPANAEWEPLPDDQITKGTPGCTYLSDPIDPWSSSSPAYLCAAPTTGSTTINYVCKFHPQERGTIVVSAT